MAGEVFKLVKSVDPDGTRRIEIEATGCADGKHLFTPLLKRGPRRGLPKPDQRCCCGQTTWPVELDAMPQVHIH